MTGRIDAGKNFALKHFVRFWVSYYIHRDVFVIAQDFQQSLNRLNPEFKIGGEIVVAGKAVSDIIAQGRDLRIEQLGIGR